MPSSAQGRAVLLLLSALVCLILLDASGKWLGMRGVPVPAIAWSRYLGHLLVVLAVFMPSRGLSILKTAHPFRQALRGLLMVSITLLYFAALKTMPLAQGAAVFFTTPILVTVLATLFLGERPGWQTWAAVALGFAGVLVIIRPGSDLPLAGSLLVLGAAAGNAAYQTLTRAQAHADSPEVQVLYSGLAGAAIMTLAAPLWWTPGWWEIPGMGALDWAVFGMLGVFGSAGHLLLARAYGLAPASRLSPWSYLQMLLSIPIGWLVFGNLPDAIALLGMVMIAISPNLTLLRQRRVPASAA
jgi:drug/metabolite transporter (DMT)-like permease